MILCIRSDSPDVYVGIWDGNIEKSGETWEAGRELSGQILSVITANCDKVAISMNDIKGVVVYQGPGSYTGLRIGISVANSVGYSNNIPVVGVGSDLWIVDGLAKLKTTKIFIPVSPEYGGEVRTTKPRK